MCVYVYYIKVCIYTHMCVYVYVYIDVYIYNFLKNKVLQILIYFMNSFNKVTWLNHKYKYVNRTFLIRISFAGNIRSLNLRLL